MIYYKCSWCSDDIERSVGGASEGYHAEYCSTKCLVEAQSAGKENKNPDRSLIEANERALERHVELYTAEVKRRDLAREKRQRKDKWIFFDFNAPALVIGKVPMQGVEFVICHEVNKALDFIDREKMSRHIEVQAAPLKLRVVFDEAFGKTQLAILLRAQLQQ